MKRFNGLVTALLLALGVGGILTSGPALAAKGGSPGRPTDGEESGNNLSTPVIWSDGATKALRETAGGPQDFLFDGTAILCTAKLPDELCYQQQDPSNVWQAESYDATTSTTSYGNPVAIGPIDGFMVDEIDWGDNLEARDWNVNSVVRVETILWQMLDDTLRSDDSPPNHSLPSMTAWEMVYLFGQGPSEMWGTTTATFPGAEATVYSGCARLTIQKIAELAAYDDENPPLLTWDPAATRWNGEGVLDPVFDGAVWEGGDGPGFYSAEINIPGRVIYGYNWNVRTTGDGDGVYRLTFSLDGTFVDGQQCGTTALNTWLDGAIVRVWVEEEGVEPQQDEGSDTGGGTAVIDAGDNLTYIDVKIIPRSGGGGTGGGGGGGGQGPGNGGPRR